MGGGSLPAISLSGPVNVLRSYIMQPLLQAFHYHHSLPVSMKTAPRKLTNHGLQDGMESFLKARNPSIGRKFFPLFKNFKAPDGIRRFPRKNIHFAQLDHLQSKHSLAFCLGHSTSPNTKCQRGAAGGYNSLSRNHCLCDS